MNKKLSKLNKFLTEVAGYWELREVYVVRGVSGEYEEQLEWLAFSCEDKETTKKVAEFLNETYKEYFEGEHYKSVSFAEYSGDKSAKYSTLYGNQGIYTADDFRYHVERVDFYSD